MRKTGQIIAYISGALVIAFALVFIYIEGRNLFSLDWKLYENPFNGFVRYFLRLLDALFALMMGVATYFILRKKNENETASLYFYFGAIALLVCSIIIGCFSSNYIDILFFVLPIIYSSGVGLYFLGTKLNSSKGDK